MVPLGQVLLLLLLLLCCVFQAAVFLLVDLVGSYKVSPEMKKKAQELRQKLEQEAVKKVSQGQRLCGTSSTNGRTRCTSACSR